MTNNDAIVYSHKLDIFLIAVGSAGVVVTIYHCIMACWCHRHRRGNNSGNQSPEQDLAMMGTPRSTENSVVQLIPAYKYEKGMGLGGGGDGTCAICLSEFEEGEEIRTLPECLHSYHAPCIDMWLYSHTQCPMCRADTTPLSPGVFPNRIQFETTQQNSGILQNVVVVPSAR